MASTNPVPEAKVPFYTQKLDEKYSILNRSIGIDTQTNYVSTRWVDMSNNPGTSGTPASYLNKLVEFNFSVSPNALIDWNNSYIQEDIKFGKADGTTAVADVILPWNILYHQFDEVNVYFENTGIMNKTGDTFGSAQTMRIINEYSKQQIDEATTVFAPVGDDYYSIGVASGLSGTRADLRNEHWLTAAVATVVKKNMTLKDLLFSVPGLSRNMRNVKLQFKLKSNIYLPNKINGGDGQIYPVAFRLCLHEYNYSPASATVGLDNKMSSTDEHICFVDVECRRQPYQENMTLTSLKDTQWVGLQQLGTDITYNSAASYPSVGQSFVLNGKPTTTLANTSMQGRADVAVSSATTLPPNTIQVQFGSQVYPSNGLQLRKTGMTSALEHSDLWLEYVKACGRPNVAIPEEIFKRTFPFAMLKPTANTKLISNIEVTFRMPGGSTTDYVRLYVARLRSFNISASGQVSEAVLSY